MLADGPRVGVRELGGDVPASLGCADLGAEQVVSSPVSAPEGRGASDDAGVVPVPMRQAAAVWNLSDLGQGTTPPAWRLPTLSDLPIPRDAKIDESWTDQMRELAAFTTPYIALLICDKFGGQSLYIPMNWETSVLRQAVPDVWVEKISAAIAPYKYFVPRARAALARARRAGVLAMVRANTLSKRNAAIILGTTRNYVIQMLKTGEGLDVQPIELPQSRAVRLVRTSAEIAADHLRNLGFSDEQIAAVTTEILELLD